MVGAVSRMRCGRRGLSPHRRRNGRVAERGWSFRGRRGRACSARRFSFPAGLGSLTRPTGRGATIHPGTLVTTKAVPHPATCEGTLVVASRRLNRAVPGLQPGSPGRRPGGRHRCRPYEWSDPNRCRGGRLRAAPARPQGSGGPINAARGAGGRKARRGRDSAEPGTRTSAASRAQAPQHGPPRRPRGRSRPSRGRRACPR